MGAMFPLLLIASLNSSAAPGAIDELMNKIERSVKLPSGADALGAYDRGYAFATPDKVVGIYLLHARAGAGQKNAAGRRWYKSVADLPSVFDGGCIQVRIEYQVSAHRVLSAVCNGYA